MSSLCSICEGYSSDGSDYYMRRRRRRRDSSSSECSHCDGSICECHDSCDCSDWESGSEREGEHERSVAKRKGNDDRDDSGSTCSDSESTSSGSESEVEDRGRKILSKDGTKTKAEDEEPEFVRVKDVQEKKAKAKKRTKDSEPQSDESDSCDSASDNEAVKTKGSQSKNAEESDKEKQNESNKDNDSESGNENSYPKEIQTFLQENGTEESADNTGVRTRRSANYYGRNSRGYRRRPRRRQNERSGSGLPGHKYRSNRHRRSTRRRKNLYSKVKMPNGEFHWITIPAAEKKSWKCGTKTELITLRPNGRMGKKEYQLISEQMEGTRKNHISGTYSGYDIIKIEKVVNPCLWKRYRHRRYDLKSEVKGFVEEQMLFHGSPAIKELIQNGFDERYSSTAGMFGAGIYFAENSSKSNQYAWGLNKGCPTHNNKNCLICERQLLLCRVTLGKIKEYTSAMRFAHAPAGYHSVRGVPATNGLQYSENIVYRGEQVYPEFLITYKLKP